MPSDPYEDYCEVDFNGDKVNSGELVPLAPPGSVMYVSGDGNVEYIPPNLDGGLAPPSDVDPWIAICQEGKWPYYT